MNKTRRCTGRLHASIRLKCNFIFTIKKILLFQPICNLPLQIFFEPIRPKCDYKMVNESSKNQSTPKLRERRSSCVAFGQEQRTRRLTNQVCIPTLPQTAYSLPTLVTHRATIPNQSLKNDLHPLSS